MANCPARGKRRPKTFDFLGFTHYCRTTRNGTFGLGRKPIGKRVGQTLRRIGAGLRRRIHDNPYEVAKWLGRVLNGWLHYLRSRPVPATSGGLYFASRSCGCGFCDAGHRKTAFRWTDSAGLQRPFGLLRDSCTHGRNSDSPSNT